MQPISKYYLWGLSVIFFVTATTIEAAENKAYLKDGKIVIETQEGVRSIDYSSRGDNTKAAPGQWNINENVSQVDEALAVYMKRTEPLYNHKIHYYGDADGNVDYFIEYTSDYEDSQYLMSPQGDHIYYLGLNAQGKREVYGHNLKDNKKIAMGTGKNFHIVTCSATVSYVVVQTGQESTYDVFDANGKKIKTITQSGAYGDIQGKIKNELCS